MYHTADFEYGPRVEDWCIWLSNPFDEWADDFWNLIEDPEKLMPGTFPE